MKYYKCTYEDGTGGYSDFVWPKDEGAVLPEVEGELVMCENGYHLCGAEDLVCWVGTGEIFEVIPDGEIIQGNGKICCRGGVRGKSLLWTERERLLWEADVAERVLHLFEERIPGDTRVRDCIEAKRKKARGESVDLSAAWDAAAAPAWDAGDAAWYAARNAVWAAAWDAAAAAAWYAARNAVWAAAWDAAERKWQNDRLWYYLNGEHLEVK